MTTNKLQCNVSVTDDVFSVINGMQTPISKMVMLGASIMDSAFNSPDDVDRVKAQYGFASVTVVDEATGGRTTGDLLALMPSILASYTGQIGVVFPVAIGGNDVSNTRPYSTATEQDIADIAGNIQDIIDLIHADGHRVIYSNITYRAYPDITSDGENGSLPYNRNITEPIIRTMLDGSWDNTLAVPFLDVYKFTFDNQDYLQTDGIHLTDEGQEAWRHYWFSQLSGMVVVDSSPLSAPSGSKIVIDFNDEVDFPQTNLRVSASGSATPFSAKTTTNINKVNSSYYNLTGFNKTGNGNDGDTSTSLTNDILLTTYIYNAAGDVMTILINNMESNTSGTLTITASRSTSTGDRFGEYTVQGITKTMDAELIPASQIDFPFTTDSGGNIEITVAVASGSTFAYVNGIQIDFN